MYACVEKLLVETFYLRTIFRLRYIFVTLSTIIPDLGIYTMIKNICIYDNQSNNE